jgi:hypothetical protein
MGAFAAKKEAKKGGGKRQKVKKVPVVLERQVRMMKS